MEYPGHADGGGIVIARNELSDMISKDLKKRGGSPFLVPSPSMPTCKLRASSTTMRQLVFGITKEVKLLPVFAHVLLLTSSNTYTGKSNRPI